jgi:hypothetical protein
MLAAGAPTYTNAQLWALVVGALLPPLVAVVQQRHWPTWLRTLVGVVASLVAGTGTVLVQHGWSWHDWVGTSLLILVASVSTYRGVWKKSGIAPKIEAMTSAGTQPQPPGSGSSRLS